MGNVDRDMSNIFPCWLFHSPSLNVPVMSVSDYHKKELVAAVTSINARCIKANN